MPHARKGLGAVSYQPGEGEDSRGMVRLLGIKAPKKQAPKDKQIQSMKHKYLEAESSKLQATCFLWRVAYSFLIVVELIRGAIEVMTELRRLGCA